MYITNINIEHPLSLIPILSQNNPKVTKRTLRPLVAIVAFLRESGKPKGFSFINFEDQRSTVLSVDNLNGIRLCNRFLKVDHVRDYKPPDGVSTSTKWITLT